MQMDLIKKKKRKGFTLIELIVVIAILGILAAIAVPRLGAYRANATLAADNASCAIVGRAAEAFVATQTNIPATITTGNITPYLDATTVSNIGNFTISIDATGNITVDGPGASAYPAP